MVGQLPRVVTYGIKADTNQKCGAMSYWDELEVLVMLEWVCMGDELDVLVTDATGTLRPKTRRL